LLIYDSSLKCIVFRLSKLIIWLKKTYDTITSSSRFRFKGQLLRLSLIFLHRTGGPRYPRVYKSRFWLSTDSEYNIRYPWIFPLVILGLGTFKCQKDHNRQKQWFLVIPNFTIRGIFCGRNNEGNLNFIFALIFEDSCTTRFKENNTIFWSY